MDIEKVKQIIDKTEKEYDETIKEKNALENTLVNNRFILKKKLSELRVKFDKLLKYELCKIDDGVIANLEEQYNLLCLEMCKLDSDVTADITNLETQLNLLKDKEIALLDKSKRFAKVYWNDFYRNISMMNWVTNIPKTNTGRTNSFLYRYSNLNVDEIGNIICYLLKEEEGNNFTSKRIEVTDGYYHYPALAIREEGNDKKASYNYSEFNKLMDSSIVFHNFPDIDIEKKDYFKDYLTNRPFISYKGDDVISFCSNYMPLLNIFEGRLFFDYKNHEIIRELIYSLANYQLVNNIKYMSAEQTQEVFKKLYKSR